MPFTIDDHEFRAAVRDIRTGLPKTALVLLRDVASRAIGDIRIEMTRPKSGRVYRRGGVVHIASAPGEYPAVDTGELAGSIRIMGSASSAEETWVEFGTDVPHGMFLEFGTARMAPRPWLRRGARQAIQRYSRQRIAKRIELFLRSVSRG